MIFSTFVFCNYIMFHTLFVFATRCIETSENSPLSSHSVLSIVLTALFLVFSVFIGQVSAFESSYFTLGLI